MISSNTCGSKAKPFRWELTGRQLKISRDFKNQPNVTVQIPLTMLEELNAFVRANGSVTLSNNVEKMHNETESFGVGTFLLAHTNLDSGQAMVASQVAAILCDCGAWRNNGMKRNIVFYSNADDCISVLRTYYANHS